MEGGGEHLYLVSAGAGQFLQVTVQQKGVDVVLTLLGPDGGLISTVDRPNGTRGRESLSAQVKDAGVYRLRISTWQRVAAQGTYALSMAAPRAPLPGDDVRVLAEQVVSEGERLRGLGTAESFRAAIGQFERAAALWQRLGEPYEEGWAWYGAGWSYASLGENQEAARCFGRATPVMSSLGDTYGEASARAGLGWAEMYLGESASALEDFTHASRLYAAAGNVRGVAVTLHGIGWLQFLAGEDEQALTSFRKALGLRREVRDRRGEALTLVGLGKVTSRLGHNEEALASLNAALAVIRELGDRYAEGDTLSHIGWVHLAGERWQEALDYFERALPLRRQTGDRTGEATTLFGIARAKRALGDLNGALAEAEGALRILETLRTKGANLQLRASYFASVRDYYQFTVDLLAELDRRQPAAGHAAAALLVSERAHARALLDLLNEARVDFRRGIPPELLERKAEAQRRLSAADERRRLLMGGPHAEAQARAAVEEVAALVRQYEEAEARVREASPRYASLTRTEPPTVADIREAVGEDSLLLEYFAGEGRSYLWVVDRGGVRLHVLPGRETLERSARAAYEAITARNRGGAGESAGEKSRRVAEADRTYLNEAAKLSAALLAPAAPALAGRRVLIVADGALQYVPFAALPAPDSGGRVNPSGAPLALTHEVVSLPSVATLLALREMETGRRRAPKSVLVLADPVFDAEDERLARGAASTPIADAAPPARGAGPGAAAAAVGRLPRLFATRWEAEQIVALAPSSGATKATDFLASRGAATSPELASYRVIHFATHALIDESHPELSGVVLSLVDEHGRPREGVLYAHDIFNLRLNAELVVLSACRTGLGREDRGEGLMGLTRGFMYAGAPRVIASLWAVNDKATAELMVHFYRKMLKENMRPAAALRAAQAEVWRDPRWRSPYYWGAFSLQGEWR